MSLLWVASLGFLSWFISPPPDIEHKWQGLKQTSFNQSIFTYMCGAKTCYGALHLTFHRKLRTTSRCILKKCTFMPTENYRL